MSEESKKRKRGLEDTAVAPSKLDTIKKDFNVLQDKMRETPKTEKDMRDLLKSITTLGNTVRSAAKQKVSFSAVTLEELGKAGVVRGRIIFDWEQIKKATMEPPTTEMLDLRSRVRKVYDNINMDHEAGSRIIIDAMFMGLAEILSDGEMKVAVVPEMRLHSSDGVLISNPTTGYELWLGGVIDYVVFRLTELYKPKVTGPGGSREEAFSIPNINTMLFEAKRQEVDMISSIPEAVGQAVALLKYKNLPEVRFCLSDGCKWMFFILKPVGETLTFYEPQTIFLDRIVVESSDLQLREIILLASEWLKPTRADLFRLE